MSARFIKYFFIYWLILWFLSFIFCIMFIGVLCLLICGYCTTLASLGWSQLGHGVWSFWCIAGCSLPVLCWEFSCLCSSVILACSFLSLVCLFLVWRLRWCWPHKKSLGVFPFLGYFGVVWEGYVLALP